MELETCSGKSFVQEELVLKRSFIIVLIFFVCFGQVSADTQAGVTAIEINLPSRTLSLYKDGVLLKEYPVCVGTKSTPTPQGEYKVVYKTVDPYWINKGTVVPPGPQNPLGKRWMGITKTIGIHGNNRPASIGTYASAGCIRMYNRDVEEIYSLVPLNTPVSIKYDRIRLFQDEYSGEKVIIIYPDSYKKDTLSVEQLLDGLERMEVSEEVMEKALSNIKESNVKPIAASKGIGIFLNESLITCDAFWEQGSIFVNCKAAEDVFGLTAGIAGIHDIDIREREGMIYVNLSQGVERLDGSIIYDADTENAYVAMKIVKVNGVFAGLNLGDYDRNDYLSVEAVRQLGYPYSEESQGISIFEAEMTKVSKNNTAAVNTEDIAKALGGWKDINPVYRIVDLKLPAYIRLGEGYFLTHDVGGRLALSAETAEDIRSKTSWVETAFSYEDEESSEFVDMESFLDNYEYEINDFRTLVDIKLEDSRIQDGSSIEEEQQ